MLVYATIGELRDFLGLGADDPTPPQAQQMLELASQLVTKAIGSARFDVDTDTGYPALAEDMAACKLATLRQVSAWVQNDVNPFSGVVGSDRTVQSRAAQGVSTVYADASVRAAALAALASGAELTPLALIALDDRNLLDFYVPPSGSHGGPTRSWPYDPTTGQFL